MNKTVLGAAGSNEDEKCKVDIDKVNSFYNAINNAQTVNIRIMTLIDRIQNGERLNEPCETSGDMQPEPTRTLADLLANGGEEINFKTEQAHDLLSELDRLLF